MKKNKTSNDNVKHSDLLKEKLEHNRVPYTEYEEENSHRLEIKYTERINSDEQKEEHEEEHDLTQGKNK